MLLAHRVTVLLNFIVHMRISYFSEVVQLLFFCLCGGMLNLVLLHHQIVNTDFRAVYLFASSFSLEIHSICSTLFTNIQIKLQIHVVVL